MTDTPSPPPNAWSVVNDYAKTIITLAGALLALFVGFAENIIGQTEDIFSSFLLFFMLVWLFLSIVFALLVIFKISNLLRNKSREENERKAILYANISYFTVGLAGLFFLIFGGLQILDRRGPADATEALQLAQQFLVSAYGDAPTNLTLTRSELDHSADAYRFTIEAQSTKQLRVVVVDRMSRAIGSVEEIKQIQCGWLPWR